jgi:hypothetical protein
MKKTLAKLYLGLLACSLITLLTHTLYLKGMLPDVLKILIIGFIGFLTVKSIEELVK